VLFWTSPVFTALLSRYYLNERLSIYDAFSVVICFIGILMIQNPFGEKAATEAKLSQFSGPYDDIIGTSLALIGSLFGALVGLYIRKISKYANMHFLLSPMGFVLGNLILCPFFMTLRILYMPVDPASAVITGMNEGNL
jgi:drug/metabolite transporter (DMT)-like permease